MFVLYCAWGGHSSISFAPPARVPKRIVLDLDGAFDAVHGGQQLRLFNGHYDKDGFQPRSERDGVDGSRSRRRSATLGVMT